MTRTYSLTSVVLLFSVPALGGFLFGYDIGATSYVISQLRDEETSGVEWWHEVRNSPAITGIIVSAGSFGALLGSLLVFQIADVIGRRMELRVGAILYMFGAVLEVWSSRVGLSILIIGRLVFGIAIGITMHGAPTYLAEMGPSSIRGLLVSLKEACIVFGILIGYVVGHVYHTTVGGWKYTYAWSMVAAVSMLALTFAIPRSYRWLLLKNLDEEAMESVRFVFSESSSAEQEFAATKQSRDEQLCRISIDISDNERNKTSSIWDEAYRGPMVAAVGLVILQQVTGQPSVLSYATPIFEAAMLSDYASILVAAFKLVATLIAALTVEKFGRKNLLYVGCSLMLVALIVLTSLFGKTGRMAETAILLAMFLYIGGYQCGFGPVTWLIISEVFPLNIRGQAVAFSVQVNFFLNAVVQFGVPLMESLIGLNATFGIFGLLTAYR